MATHAVKTNLLTFETIRFEYIKFSLILGSIKTVTVNNEKANFVYIRRTHHSIAIVLKCTRLKSVPRSTDSSAPSTSKTQMSTREMCSCRRMFFMGMQATTGSLLRAVELLARLR